MLGVGIDLTTNQCHRSNWPDRWISGEVFYSVERSLIKELPFNYLSWLNTNDTSISQSQYTVIFMSINISV